MHSEGGMIYSRNIQSISKHVPPTQSGSVNVAAVGTVGTADSAGERCPHVCVGVSVTGGLTGQCHTGREEEVLRLAISYVSPEPSAHEDRRQSDPVFRVRRAA